MGDLQATIEFSVELYKFYNVDLFQRGLYQVRCSLRVSPRLPVQVETSIPDQQQHHHHHQQQQHHQNQQLSKTQKQHQQQHEQQQQLITEEYHHQQQQQHKEQFNNYLPNSACIVGGAGASRVFQILYRNEEVNLRDVILFRAHLLVDSRHLKESIERAEFSLNLELWFGEQNGSNGSSSLSLASSRILQLNFHPGRGLHYHLPVLFDYFHLAAVSLGIHASLVALHQPYMNAPRSSKPWVGSGKQSCRSRGLEAIFFGPQVGGSIKCSGSSSGRLLHARYVHQEICALLLGAIESLKLTLNEFKTVLPHRWNSKSNLLSSSTSLANENDTNDRLQKLTEQAKIHDTEDEFAIRANADIAQLCAECIMYWRRVISVASEPSIHSLLAKKHHTLRVRRFAEGFFVMENSRHNASGCYDNNYQNYVAVCEMARRSRYMQSLPPLPVHCTPLDGDSNSLPLIFEDRFIDPIKYSRRTGSDPHLNGHEPTLSKPSEIVKSEKMNTIVSLPKPPRKECSCGIAFNNYSNERFNSYLGVMTPRFALGGDILQASLTITPAAASKGIRQRTMSRHSVSTLLDGSECILNHKNNLHHASTTATLPTRHSKSLDQLETSRQVSSLPRHQYPVQTHVVNTHHHHNHNHVSVSPDVVVVKGKVQAEDLLRNINEFREKYKNPCSSRRTQQNNPCTIRNGSETFLPQCFSNNNGITPNRDYDSIQRLKSSKYDYLREIKMLNQPYKNNTHYNSLPKDTSTATPIPRNSYPPIGGKKQHPHTNSPYSQSSAGTIPRSNSSQTLRNNQSIPRSVEIARVRVTDLREMIKNKVFSKDSSSDSDTPTDKIQKNKEHRLLSSASVPFKLESLDNNENSALSESLPNLPSSFAVSPTNGKFDDDSTSSLSEQSGWVSSRRTSDSSSPEIMKKDHKIHEQKFDQNETKNKILNGEQLRKRLQKLLDEQLINRDRGNQKSTKFHNLQNGDIPIHKKISTVTVDANKIEPLRNSNTKKPKRNFENDRNKCRPIQNGYHSFAQKDFQNMNRSSIKQRKSTERSKSEFDLTNVNEIPFDHFHVPPPKQFQDDVLPPDEFRDPPLPQPAEREPVGAIDNPVYHIYEALKPSCKPVLKSQSSTELTEAIDSVPHTSTSASEQNDKNTYCTIERSDSQKSNKNPKRKHQESTLSLLEFERCREEFRKQINYNGSIYSDFPKLASELPYFHISDEYRAFSPNGLHLIICVHGLDGNSADLRLVRTYLELGLPGANLEFLMSERNQGDTFSDFDTMTDRLVAEIIYHVDTCGLNPTRISFVAHSLGTIIVRSALARPQMRPLLPKLHTFLSLSGPHLGTLYNSSGLVNMGMWFMQKWKKSGSLLQLCLRDAPDLRQSFLYRLSQRSTLHHFKNVVLCGSSQDRYVPPHSARLELCKGAIRDNSTLGAVYREMVHNIITPMLARPELTLARYDVHHALPHTANTLIGRAAHIAVLDSELFIEKFLLVAGLKYFS